MTGETLKVDVPPVRVEIVASDEDRNRVMLAIRRELENVADHPRIVALPKAPPARSIVQLAEDMLARAKRGEIIAIAVAAHVRVDGVDTGTSSAYSLGDNGDVAHLVCAIERVKLALLAAGSE